MTRSVPRRIPFVGKAPSGAGRAIVLLICCFAALLIVRQISVCKHRTAYLVRPYADYLLLLYAVTIAIISCILSFLLDTDGVANG